MSVTTTRSALTMPYLHSQKMDAVTRLAGGLSNDVGSLVDSAAASVRDALAVVGPINEPCARLEEAVVSLQRAAMIARQLRAISQEHPQHPMPRDMGDKVAELVPLIKRLSGNNISLTTGPFDDACWIEADSGQIEQVLFHLVVNARDAMPLGGDLSVRVDLHTVDESIEHRFGVIAPGLWCVLEVADTGLGMEEEVLQRLFEPFFTTKGPGLGSGLGLATVYGIAHQLAGQVRVISSPGKGTRLSVWLPAASAPVGNSTNGGADVDSQSERTSVGVLVVDEDPWGRSVMSRALRRAGFGVLEAANGKEAFETLRDVAGGCVHVVVADLRLAGMSGFEFARELQSREPRIKVVLTTSSDSQPDQALPDNCHLLKKPYSRAQLVAAVTV